MLGSCVPEKNLIGIHPRQSAFSYMETMIHEHLHLFFPNLSETQVTKAAAKTARALWDHNYRKIAT